MDHFHSNPTNHIFHSNPILVIVEGPQHITVMVQTPSLEFAFTIVYASYRPREQESLWDDLVQFIKDYATFVEAHWFLAGDFNCIRRVNERQARGYHWSAI